MMLLSNNKGEEDLEEEIGNFQFAVFAEGFRIEKEGMEWRELIGNGIEMID